VTLIPGFSAVKDAALSAGALGCSIAGSGPSVFAFASDDDTAARIGAAMRSAFKSAAQLDSDVYSGMVNPVGARQV
jgi:homoserine kinase